MTSRICARLNDEEAKLIRSYAAMNNISVSALIRQTILEKIEDEYDLKLLRKALAEWEKNPITYTLDEVGRMLDFQ